MTEFAVTPHGPYSLRASLDGLPGHSHRRAGRVEEIAFRVGREAAIARVWQHPDGSIAGTIGGDVDADAAVRELRFVLAVDDDHSEFLTLAADDDLLRRVIVPRRGFRPARTSVAQALLHGFAGQLVSGREAHLIEAAISRRLATPVDGLLLPLTSAELGGAGSAELTRHRLAPRRARALVHATRTLDLDALRSEPVETAVARLLREPQIGPWTAGVVALRALGSYAHGIVGDLNLLRLCAKLLGRDATVADTADLLDRYGPWAGLASMHLVRHPLAHR